MNREMASALRKIHEKNRQPGTTTEPIPFSVQVTTDFFLFSERGLLKHLKAKKVCFCTQ